MVDKRTSCNHWLLFQSLMSFNALLLYVHSIVTVYTCLICRKDAYLYCSVIDSELRACELWLKIFVGYAHPHKVMSQNTNNLLEYDCAKELRSCPNDVAERPICLPSPHVVKWYAKPNWQLTDDNVDIDGPETYRRAAEVHSNLKRALRTIARRRSKCEETFAEGWRRYECMTKKLLDYKISNGQCAPDEQPPKQRRLDAPITDKFPHDIA